MNDSVYAAVGGQPFFDALVAQFYERVEADPVLRPLYPDDLAPGQRSLALFLAQYWGGPPEYSAEKGPPRLRMRHVPFRITERERHAWMAAMDGAITAMDPPESVARQLREYFEMAATAMINARMEP